MVVDVHVGHPFGRPPCAEEDEAQEDHEAQKHDGEEEEHGDADARGEEVEQRAEGALRGGAEVPRAQVVSRRAGSLHELLVERLGGDGLPLHAQAFFGGLRLRDEGPGDEVDDRGYLEAEEGEDDEHDAPGQRVRAAEEAAESGHHAAEQLVVGVAVEGAAGRPLRVGAGADAGVAGAVAGRWRGRGAVLFGRAHVLGVADASDDVLHVFDGDGLHAVRLHFGEEFGHAVLDIVGDFVAAVLPAEVALHVFEILLEEFHGVFVDGVELSEEIDGDILFHDRENAGLLVG